MVKIMALTKRFSGVLALDNVTQEFPAKGVVSIVGPNGAGKSTLLNVITGFARPDSGAWFIAGFDVSRLRPWQIAQRGVSRTFQQVRLAESFTASENLALARRSGEESLWRAITGARANANTTPVDETLEALGLSDSRGSVGEFSYGQKKLLSIACCLASGARVLLLDEPVAGVHPVHMDRIVAVLRRSAALGTLVILVEHDLRFVRDVSDEVIMMRSGRVVRHGSVAAVFGDAEGMLDVFLG